VLVNYYRSNAALDLLVLAAAPQYDAPLGSAYTFIAGSFTDGGDARLVGDATITTREQLLERLESGRPIFTRG